MIDDLRNEMELPEGTLVTNIFVPLMVVCSKMDLVEHGEKELKSLLEQNLDFLQHSLRKFCLTYGASLAFASSNSNSNIKLIYEYILHRLYETEFAHTSNTNDKDALFIPTGFDSSDLIEKQIDVNRFKIIYRQNEQKQGREVLEDYVPTF